MTFGQQPGNGDPYYGGNQQQPAYGQQQYGQSQYSYAPNGTAAINAQTIYSREQVQAAQRASVTRAYGEMTLGLIITAVVAVVAQSPIVDQGQQPGGRAPDDGQRLERGRGGGGQGEE